MEREDEEETEVRDGFWGNRLSEKRGKLVGAAEIGTWR
jgi:hypothetical protein